LALRCDSRGRGSISGTFLSQAALIDYLDRPDTLAKVIRQ